MTKRNYTVLERTAGSAGRTIRENVGEGWLDRFVKRHSANSMNASEFFIYSHRNA